MQYVNPATGGYAMPTIGAFVQMLPAGFHGESYRATDGTVYCVVEGRGSSRVGDETFEWEAHDVFVVPSWCPAAHQAGGHFPVLRIVGHRTPHCSRRRGIEARRPRGQVSDAFLRPHHGEGRPRSGQGGEYRRLPQAPTG